MPDRNAFGLPGIPRLPNPYGLGSVFRSTAPEPQPVAIGPVVVPLYAPAAPQPPLAPEPRKPVAGAGGSVVPFRATNPISPQTSPLSDASATPKPTANIPVPQLAQMQKKAESSGNYLATNKHTTASGAYQYTDGTWNGYGGYKRALYAPPEVQDRRFMEDVAKRIQKYNGDAFKALAEHYLPAAANRPETWTQPFRLKSRGRIVEVPPVANYLRHVLKGTQYEKQLDAYLAAH